MSGLGPGAQITINGRGMVFTSSPPRVSSIGTFGSFWTGTVVTISGTKFNNGSFRISDNNPNALTLTPSPMLETMGEADTIHSS